MAKVNSKIEVRPLYEIALEIKSNWESWRKSYARDYLEAMSELSSIGRLILGRGLERFTYARQLITPKLTKLCKQRFTTKWSTKLSVITLSVCSPNLKDADTDSRYGCGRTI